MLRLVRPSIKYKKTYIQATKEFQKEGRLLQNNVQEMQKSFGVFLRKYTQESNPKKLPKGIVPQTTYWLVEGSTVIGMAALRHRLNKKLKSVGGHIGYQIRPSKRRRGYGKAILSLVLPKAKKFGITKALITCDGANIASRKIIESCGGILKNEVRGKKGEPDKLRFWIHI